MFSLHLIHDDTPAAKLANRVEILVNIVLNTLTPDVPNTLIGNMARACKHGRDFFYKNPVLEPVYVLPPLRYLGVGCHVFPMEREIMNDRYKNLWEDICHAFKKEGAEPGRRWGGRTIRHEYVFRDVHINQCEKFWDNPKDINRIGLIIPRTFSKFWKTELEIYGTCLKPIGDMKTSKQDPNIYQNTYDYTRTKVIAFCPCYDTREYVAVWDDVEKPPRRIPRNELPEFVMSHARKVMECRGAFVKKLESADAGTEPVV
jgi:hypothetical protein